jgi:predicted permease
MEVRKLGKAVISASLKVIIIPAIAVIIAVLMGFRDVQLGMILITFGSPMAVTGYIMAKNMGSDAALAAQILLISTVMCAFTMFLGIFVLASFAFIPTT